MFHPQRLMYNLDLEAQFNLIADSFPLIDLALHNYIKAIYIVQKAKWLNDEPLDNDGIDIALIIVANATAKRLTSAATLPTFSDPE